MSKEGRPVRRKRAPSGAAEAMARLGEAGQKSFTRRKAIIEAFFEATEGLTAHDLRERVRGHGQPVSLATVQLTLRRLVEHGLADVHRRAGDLARFSPVTSGPGDGRLVCVACRSATPFSDTVSSSFTRRSLGPEGFAVRGRSSPSLRPVRFVPGRRGEVNHPRHVAGRTEFSRQARSPETFNHLPR